MPTTIKLSRAVRRTKPKAELPPFFDGKLRLRIVMAISKWGPMRLFEIEEIYGQTVRSSNTNRAAAYLEQLGIVVRKYGGGRNITVGLDRRHPAFDEIQRFGLAMYRKHFAPTAVKTPEKRRRPISPRTPKHSAAKYNMQALGNMPAIRFLHILREIRSCPSFVLGRSQGIHQGNMSVSLAELERHGIIRKLFKGSDVFIRLNVEWDAHRRLVQLLHKLNTYLPEYAGIAKAYRLERDHGHYTRKWRVKRKARVRAAAEAATNARREEKRLKSADPSKEVINERKRRKTD